MEEMLNKPKLERLLRDSYANYVVQTALDYAEPVQRVKVKRYRLGKKIFIMTNILSFSLSNVFAHCYLLYATHLMANASRAKSIVNHSSDQSCIIMI